MRQRSSDLEALPAWMKEAVRCGDEGGNTALARLVAQRQRHAECFLELQRQVSAYSGQLATLLGRVWDGEERIVGGLIASCQRLEAESAEAEAVRRTAGEAARRETLGLRLAVDDAHLEVAVSQSTLRERASEVEALRRANDGLEAEVRRLRLLVGRHVEGVTEDVDEEEAVEKAKMRLLAEAPCSPEDLERLARLRSQSVFEANDAIDACLADLEREHERQKHIVRDLEASVRESPLETRPPPVFAVDAASQCDWVHRDRRAAHDRRHPPPSVQRGEIMGGHMPALLRCQMSSFPKSRRVPSLDATLRLVLRVHFDKVDYDARCDGAKRPRLALGAFVYKWLLARYGRRGVADERATQLVQAVERHASAHKRVRLFGEWIGLTAQALDVRDSNVLSSLFAELRRINELGRRHVEDGAEPRVDVGRKKAVDAVRCLFAARLPDRAIALVARTQSLPPTPQNPRCVDLDDLVEVALQAWVDVAESWRQHAAFLFHRHKALFAVREEMRFATDAEPDRDALLVQVDHAANFALREARQPTNKFVQNISDDTFDDDDASGKRPELVALVTADAFRRLARHLDPYASIERIDELFEAGCALMRSKIIDDFLHVWDRYCLDDDGAPVPFDLPAAREPGISSKLGHRPSPVDEHDQSKDDDLPPRPQPVKLLPDDRGLVDPERVFWHSPHLDRSQWSPPFDPKNFVVNEFDAPVLTDLCLDHDLFVDSPFTRVLDKAPSDLWPNSEAYLAQLEDNTTLFG